MSRPVPHKRSHELEKRITKRICEGASLSDAPQLEGVNEATFRRWRQCEKESEDLTLPLRDRRCWGCTNCTLQAKCDEAESHFKNECVQTIYKAGKKNWRARAWLLERRHRDEYGLSAILETKQDFPLVDPTMELINYITKGTGAERETSARRP